MRRREFITLVGNTVVMWPLAALAQQPDRVRLIGVLMGFAESDPAGQSEVAAIRDALMKLGWTEGSNLRIELRWSAGDPDRMTTFAKELVDLRPDAILSQSTPVINALARETQTIPIVFAAVGDPIGNGFATSLAHPGGNITGFTSLDSGIGGKWVELLKEIAPRTVRVALLFNPTTAGPIKFYMPSIQAAAASFAVLASAAPVNAKNEIEGVIAALARDPSGGLIVIPDPFSVANTDLIVALAARYGVPTIYFDRRFAKSGGLISYGIDFVELYRQAAGYIDRILKGAKPGELPIQLPTNYELIINLKTAKAQGLSAPPLMLGRADEVIE
jgi:putative ABC transport system substrate-binding protein